MNAKRGKFVYSEDKYSKPGSSGIQHPLLTKQHATYVSPRKRRRSPESEDGSTPITSGIDTSTGPIFGGSVGDKEDDEKYLDELGTAALEVYELSQQVVYPISNPIIETGFTLPLTNKDTQINNEPQFNTSLASFKEIPEKMDEVKDKLCTMDGENKILRSENEKLQRELRKKEDELQGLFLSHKKENMVLEQQMKKEQQSYKSDLAFKDKDIQDLLEEKCRLLQIREKQLEPSNNLPSSHKPVSSKHKPMDRFLSTEDFIPSSQVMSSQVTKIQVGRKRTQSLSSGINGNQVNSTPETKSSKLSSLQTSSRTRSKTDKYSQTETNDSNKCRSDLFPSFEMTGSELLRVLIRRELLEVPDWEKLKSQIESDHTPPLSSEVAEQDQLTGLLSLLHSPNIPRLPNLDSSSTSSSMFVPTVESPVTCVTPVSKNIPHQKPSYRLGHSHLETSPFVTPLGISSARLSSISETKRSSSSETLELSSSTVTYPNSSSSLFGISSSLPLQKSIASLLRSSDSSVSLSTNKMPNFSLESLSSSAFGALDPTSPDCGVSLLPHLESVVDGYYQELQTLASMESSSPSMNVTITPDHSSGSSSSNTSSLEQNTETDSSATTSTLDYQSLSSSYSSSSGSQCSIAVVSNPSPKTLLKKQQVLQILYALETLCKYSRQVREAIIHVSLPPKLLMNSQFDSSGKMHSDSSAGESSESSEDEGRMEVNGRNDIGNGHTSNTCHKMWKDQPLTHCTLLGGALSSKVLVLRAQEKQSNPGFFTPSSYDIPHYRHGNAFKSYKSTYTGNLFDTLLNLTVTSSLYSLKEDSEILIVLLEILIALTEDCTDECLERYSVLIKKEKNSLESLLRREDPVVTLKVIDLLSRISRSNYIVKMLCTNSKSCVLGNCYSLFSNPPHSSTPSMKINIWIQLTRFISQVLLTESGPNILLESITCCSLYLLRYLLTCLVGIVQEIEAKKEETNHGITKRNCNLCRMMLRLLHMITLDHTLYDELRRDCNNKYYYIYCINTSLQVMKGTPIEELLQESLDMILSDEEEEMEEDIEKKETSES